MVKENPAVVVASHRIGVAHMEGLNHKSLVARTELGDSSQQGGPTGLSGLALHMPVLWYWGRARRGAEDHLQEPWEDPCL